MSDDKEAAAEADEAIELAKKDGSITITTTVTIDDTVIIFEGTPEEVTNLKGLLDDVTEQCYLGDMKSFIADLAKEIENISRKSENTVLCCDVIVVIESWAKMKLQAIDDAIEIISALEHMVTGVGADAWAKASEEPPPFGARDEEFPK